MGMVSKWNVALVAWLFLVLGCKDGRAEHRIGVRTIDGVGEFYTRETGDTFTPRGNNYIRLAEQVTLCCKVDVNSHSLFNIGLYDISDVETVLSSMEASGYNAVRVWLNTFSAEGISGASGLSRNYLSNVTDFLRRAESHGIFVLIVSDFLPQNGRYPVVTNADFSFPNSFYLAPSGVEGYSQYWTDVIAGLSSLDAPFGNILGFEIQNELYFDSTVPPLSRKSGSVRVANGKTYDLTDSASRQLMLEDGLVYFIDTVRSAILKADPTALVTISFIGPPDPDEHRKAIRGYPAICCSTADFIDLHPYILDLTLKQLINNIDTGGLTAKPFIMGEFGTFAWVKGSAEEAARVLQKWQTDSCALGFKGWFLWTWDRELQEMYWPASAGNGVINNALKPSSRADPCLPGPYSGENVARDGTAMASRSANENPPDLAIDGTERGWSAGAFPPQWIEVSLREPTNIGRVRLTVGQFPDGPTSHKVYARGVDGQLHLIAEFTGVTETGQLLEWTPNTSLNQVIGIRVETLTSPSWVAWREIEILREAPPILVGSESNASPRSQEKRQSKPVFDPEKPVR